MKVKGMKAYIIDCGVGTVDSNLMVQNDRLMTWKDPDVRPRWFYAPSYAVLIDHPEVGYIMYDMGTRPDANEYWPEAITTVDRWTGNEEQTVLAQFAKIGVKPEDVKYVIMSHMHMDHIDNIALFKDTAEFFVHIEEIKNAFAAVAVSPDRNEHGWYIREEIQTEVKRYHYIDRDTELFPGVTLVMLPGHTPGTMGVLLEMENDTLLITSDALNCQANYDGILPGIIRDPLTFKESVRRIKDLEKEYGATVLYGHDIDQFETMKKVPDFYC